MRRHYWQYLVGENGEPITSAEIYVYKAALTVAANLYPSETGGTVFQSYPAADGGTQSDIILTGLDGFFEFWIGDQDEASGYATTQKFKLGWYKTGIAAGEIDYIDVFTPLAEVDETDTDTTKNKMLSNFLAKKWNDHADEVILIDTPHDIGKVDETDTSVVIDKVVSNNLAKGWEDHKDSITTTSDPHGITEVDETSTNTVKDKLVSNNLMYTRPYRELFSVPVSAWSGSGPYTADIVNTEGVTYTWNYPEIELWRDSTGKRVMPADVEYISATTVRVSIATLPATFGTSKALVIG